MIDAHGHWFALDKGSIDSLLSLQCMQVHCQHIDCCDVHVLRLSSLQALQPQLLLQEQLTSNRRQLEELSAKLHELALHNVDLQRRQTQLSSVAHMQEQHITRMQHNQAGSLPPL